MKIDRKFIPSYILRNFIDMRTQIKINNGWDINSTGDGLWLYHEMHGSCFFASNGPHFKTLELLRCSVASVGMINDIIGMDGNFVLPELWLAEVICIQSALNPSVDEDGESRRSKWFELYLEKFAGTDFSARDMLLRLSASKVCIIGVGGLGSTLSLSLAASGVGSLVLVDGDDVEENNLTRQLFYTEKDIGKLKVDCLAKCINANNSQVKVHTLPCFIDSDSSAVNAVLGSDLVVLCADTPGFKIRGWVGKACLDNLIPHIAMAGHWVGPLSVPFRSPCHVCIGRLHGACIQDARGLVTALLKTEDKPSPRGSFGPRPLILAGLLSSLILHYLTGVDQETPLHRRFSTGLFGDVESEEMVRFRDCLSCGERSSQKRSSAAF